MRTLFTLLIVATLAGPAAAGCPDAEGLFTTIDGTLLAGRASEAYCGGNPGQPGNTENALSWDGSTLGTEWRIWGMQIDAAGPQIQYSTVDGDGDGIAAYSTNYDGGQVWLSKDGAWGDGVNDLVGTVNLCLVDIQITYSAFVPVQANSNIVITGTIDECDNGCVIEYIVTNAAMAWHPSWGTPMPSGYPGFLCGAAIGELFDICCPRMSIDCVIANEDTDWGTFKTLFR